MRPVYRIVPIALVAACLVLSTGCPFGNQGPVPGETRTFDGMEFQWCPPGTFTMGSPVNEVDRQADETQHQVTISKGFWLGKYEVAQAQWIAVMGSNPSGNPGSTEPVEVVSWNDAQIFIATLNADKAALGGPYRLPTESEWEYAYRARTTTRFYWGEDAGETAIDDYAWYFGNSGGTTHPVGEKMPNAWGLYDMSGDVSEWCQDWYGVYPAGPVTDPQGPPTGEFRVTRGGDWNNGGYLSRAAGRRKSGTAGGFANYGFRLLRTAD